MGQRLKILAALLKDPGLVPSTNMAVCNYSSRKSDTLFWHTHVAHTQTYMQV